MRGHEGEWSGEVRGTSVPLWGLGDYCQVVVHCCGGVSCSWFSQLEVVTALDPWALTSDPYPGVLSSLPGSVIQCLVLRCWGADVGRECLWVGVEGPYTLSLPQGMLIEGPPGPEGPAVSTAPLLSCVELGLVSLEVLMEKRGCKSEPSSLAPAFRTVWP